MKTIRAPIEVGLDFVRFHSSGFFRDEDIFLLGFFLIDRSIDSRDRDLQIKRGKVVLSFFDSAVFRDQRLTCLAIPVGATRWVALNV